MKTLPIKTALLLLAVTVLFSAGCGTFTQTPQEKEETAALVAAAIEKTDIYIVIDRIQPMSMPPRETMDGYTVSVKDGVLKCYLPYIGSVRYSFTDENAIAIDADNVPVDVKVTRNPRGRKCFALLEFSFKSRYNQEIFNISIETYSNALAYIRAESLFRDIINYTGHLENRPAKKENK